MLVKQVEDTLTQKGKILFVPFATYVSLQLHCSLETNETFVKTGATDLKIEYVVRYVSLNNWLKFHLQIISY